MSYPFSKKVTVNGFTSKAQAMRELRAMGHRFVGLLAAPESNPKLAKNSKVGIYSRPMHLAPGRESGFQTCPKASAGCLAACLNTAGNPAYLDSKIASRIDKTRAYMNRMTRLAFMAVLTFELIATLKKADSLGMQCGIRLNATSDISWESVAIEIGGTKYANLMVAFPQIEFYDYTAIPKRAIKFASGNFPENYHLTFSRKENNDSDCRNVINAGGNVAMVFAAKNIAAQSEIAKRYGFDANLVNADDHDFRPLDGKGVIAALYAKGDAKTDESGFVMR